VNVGKMVRVLTLAFLATLFASRAICQAGQEDATGKPAVTRARPSTESIQSLAEYVDSVKSARFQDYQNTRIKDSDEFDKMKRYLLERYDGVESLHSFVDAGEQVWDCIPIRQQPGLRGSNQPIPKPPDLPKPPDPSQGGNGLPPDARHVPAQLSPGKRHHFGNEVWCGGDSIPLNTISFEVLSRFRTLQDFFRK
jgi:hypothetical protein